MTRRLSRRWTWQMVLNLVLVAGIFIAAGVAAERSPDWLSALPGGASAGLWLGAMLLSLPLLIATYRKLQALGMLLGETASARVQDKLRAAGVQVVIANTVLFAGVILMALVVLVFSLALLPSWKVLVPLLGVVAGVTVLLWRKFIRVYSRAQVALEETLAQPPAPPHQEAPGPLAGLLKEAQVGRVTVGDESAARGKLIGELALRTQTGASIVAIERDGACLVNPGPDEELLAGDQLLLLGSGPQLESASRVLDQRVGAEKSG